MVCEPSQIRGADDEEIFNVSNGVIHIVGDTREDLWAKALHGNYSM